MLMYKKLFSITKLYLPPELIPDLILELNMDKQEPSVTGELAELVFHHRHPHILSAAMLGTDTAELFLPCETSQQEK